MASKKPTSKDKSKAPKSDNDSTSPLKQIKPSDSIIKGAPAGLFGNDAVDGTPLVPKPNPHRK
jgi:hypothetical protein